MKHKHRSCTDKARSQLGFRFDRVFWSSLKLHLTRNVFFVSQTSGTFDYFGLISSENLNTLDLLLVWLNSATRDSEPPSKQKRIGLAVWIKLVYLFQYLSAFRATQNTLKTEVVGTAWRTHKDSMTDTNENMIIMQTFQETEHNFN